METDTIHRTGMTKAAVEESTVKAYKGFTLRNSTATGTIRGDGST